MIALRIFEANAWRNMHFTPLIIAPHLSLCVGQRNKYAQVFYNQLNVAKKMNAAAKMVVADALLNTSKLAMLLHSLCFSQVH